jgi:hypothetical protein
MEGKEPDDGFEEGKEAAEPGDWTIVNKAIAYCTSHKFEDMTDDFCREHAHVFEDALEAKSDEVEHKLEYSALHQEYMKMFEAKIEGSLVFADLLHPLTNYTCFRFH